jgi:phenylpropionate dioxygenase-like ring-hydroxylating dioxygenase large terminal subunit
MFGAVDAEKRRSAVPRGCTFQESDWLILSAFWHPVMYSHEFSDKPKRARLLDVDLVVFRTEEGIAVARDLCPHRGTRLSQGRVVGTNLICPMHGLQFAADGGCTRIPAMGEQQRIPPKMRLQSCQVTERYGLVWACLAPEPIQQLMRPAPTSRPWPRDSTRSIAKSRPSRGVSTAWSNNSPDRRPSRGKMPSSPTRPSCAPYRGWDGLYSPRCSRRPVKQSRREIIMPCAL